MSESEGALTAAFVIFCLITLLHLPADEPDRVDTVPCSSPIEDKLEKGEQYA
jgi:hypothetical protein